MSVAPWLYNQVDVVVAAVAPVLSEMQMRPSLPDIAKFMRTVITDVQVMSPEEQQMGRIPEIVKQIAGLLGYVIIPVVGVWTVFP